MKILKLDLNITKFISEGKFGFVKLGDTKKYLEYQFFLPEDWLSEKTKDTSQIWRYGNFELHFDENNSVTGIFNDYVPNLEGGKFINICDWWILKKGKKAPSLNETIQELNRLKLDFNKVTDKSNLVTLSLNNYVYLVFDDINENNMNPNEYRLIEIGKRNFCS